MSIQTRLQRLESELNTRTWPADRKNTMPPFPHEDYARAFDEALNEHPMSELLAAYLQVFERAATKSPMSERQTQEMQGWIENVKQCRRKH